MGQVWCGVYFLFLLDSSPPTSIPVPNLAVLKPALAYSP